MGFGAKATASRDRYANDEWKNVNGTNTTNTSQQTQQNTAGQTTGATDATFNSPQGQSVLNALTGQVVGGGAADYVKQAGDTYGAMSRDTGAINPEVENVIGASNREADKTFGNRLMQLRAGGYRGGTAANINGQGRYASDFTAQQQGVNSSLRYGAFNDAQKRGIDSRATGAAGLGALGQGQQGLGQAILALLRGQSSTGTTAGSATGSSQTLSIEDIIQALTGGSSGTKSNTGGSAGVSLGTGGG